MIKQPLVDGNVEGESLPGIFRGVVENNNDPLKVGRCKIRVWGIHTKNREKEDTDGIPTSELPWAEPCLPIVEGSVSGFGVWSVPVQGSHVFLFFENGHPMHPRYFATVPGIPEVKPNKDDGFSDPDGTYPTNARLGESDYHRLARGVSTQTLVTTKNNNRVIGIPKGLGGVWNEPTSPYAANYPDNLVITVHGGITLELDSTNGEERFHIYHPSNSYIEIDHDGNMVIKNNANKYEITLEDRNIYIKQNNSRTVDGDDKLRVKGDVEKEITGDVKKEITGDVNREVGGDVDDDISGNLNITVSGNVNITASGNVNVQGTTINLN